MCSNPITEGEVTFACRICDECIATRRQGWVARAMAEKATSPYTYAITLTYANQSEFQKDGAAMFRYADVNAFLKRLLRQATYHHGKGAFVRFLCAGEQGDRYRRVHWHIIVYSNAPVLSYGVWKLRGKTLTTDEEKITRDKRKKRINWSIWPHGFCLVQEPDQGGMAYVLSYCLKDQFTVERAAGTARENKVENFATGLFRMSKNPPIGWDFVQQKLDRLRAMGAVLPKPELTIPGLTGFWYPRGICRQRLLVGLRQINNRHLGLTGQDLPQWSSLLGHCTDNINDLECLINDPQNPEEEWEDFARKISLANREQSRKSFEDGIRRNCGGKLPCNACLRGFSPERLSTLGVEFFIHEDGKAYFKHPDQKDGDSVHRLQHTQSGAGINPACSLKDSPTSKRCFPHSAGKAFD